MSKPTRLEYEQCYHLYNRGNNRETVYLEERNYYFFMQLYARHVYAVADSFAYCLLPNHFHLLVRIKPEKEILKTYRVINARGLLDTDSCIETRNVSPSQCFGNLFNAYTKSFNKVYQRTGSLFEKPFHRKLVTDGDYFKNLVLYIHYNPQKHGLIDDYRLWPFSSYTALLSNQPTRLKRDEVLAAYGG